MARTAEMRLVELMVLKQDVYNVILYLGKNGNFQFQDKKHASEPSAESEMPDIDSVFFESLEKVRSSLGLEILSDNDLVYDFVKDTDRSSADKIISAVNEIEDRLEKCNEEINRISSAYKEALSFSNLQVPYSQLENLSFLSLRIGHIPKDSLNDLVRAAGSSGVIIPLGEDKTKIMAVSSKKGRFALDTELNKFGFVNMEIPSGFKGIPEDLLSSMEAEKLSAEKQLDSILEEKNNYAETHSAEIKRLLGLFCVAKQVSEIKTKLESTSMVYRITGWIPASDSRTFMKDIDQLSEGRAAIREYLPSEVPSVLRGEEKVPVKLKHGKFVAAFERMIFSYGSPLYGNVDPTPFVAVFFTVLYGIMFGDFGQGMVFFLLGILMALNLVKLKGWNKFAPVFMGIGLSSAVMGLVTGEFFGTEKVLEPFAHFVTGLFGQPRAPILKVMPSSGDANSVKVIFGIFAFTIMLGILINSAGLIVNFFNNIIRKKYGSAFFGKNGLSGILFYWYVLAFAVRLAFFSHVPLLADWIIIGLLLFLSSFGEPFERFFDGERPVVENGVGALLIGGFVEIIEVISGYLSGTLSFVRVGAFALAHAVLGFIIGMMSEKCGPVGGLFVLIAGNAIVIVLEGMIVAIQVIRLQYYEFFSKFFSETGKEFIPVKFHYENKIEK